ncbi:hypothetical protein ACJ73_01642 [Blastomyces percursus]|uniref:E3 ubiquitin-protein ligase listerin n=1 Tax=Blastomyces percursus TaxID=1658174 RepID=A0A1J9RG52_9EURO|nr:hypothetical protein ACJ73_01642 [Blastomyces percursus]
MSKKFKSQASSSRAASGGFGSSAGAFGSFSTDSMTQGGASSSLSYIAEPPDLSKISQPQLVVSFKNLLKKDTTTKTKALEDLQDFLCAQDTRSGSLEDGLIEAWIKIYPRMSIDISRRVRQLAHVLQGRFVSLSGRRIAPYISRVVGAWLAGLYDSDKLVFRAARESVVRAFPTEEKRQSLWKIYRSSIFEFVIDAVLEQTPQTLSDERTVRPDEAEAKHARVVGTALQVFKQLLAKSSTAQLDKDSDFIATLITSKSLWSFSCHEDPFVRRSTYDLLRILLSMKSDLIEWKTISTCFLSKALPTSQLGSALDFSNVLLILAKEHPQLWTSDYSGKVSATKRLYQYIKKGSEGADAVYWRNLQLLVKSIPVGILITQPVSDDSTVQDANRLMDTIHDSVLSREEQGANLGAAWSCYVDTGFWISSFISDKVARHKFLQNQISPILEQYILGHPDNGRWSLNGNFAPELCAKTFVVMAEHAGVEVVQSLWMSLSDRLIETIRLSSPEKASGFKESQDSICAQAKRLFALEGQVLAQVAQNSGLAFVSNIFRVSATPVLQASVELLRSRNGKPYGAASMIDEAITRTPDIAAQVEELEMFLSEDIARLLFSPSADRLISILFGSRGKKGFQCGLKASIDTFLETDLGSSALPGLQKLFSCITFSDTEAHPKLELLIMKDLDRALHNNREAWMEIITLIKNRALRNGIVHRILNSLVDSPSSEENIREVLYGLFQIALGCPEIIRGFVNSPDGSRMLSKILYISESSTDEAAQLADSLQIHIRDIIKGESGTRSSIEIIQQNFSNVEIESLSVDALVGIAEEVLAKTSVEDKPRILSRLLPTRDHWGQALDPFLRKPLKSSAAITDTLAGAVFLVDRYSIEGLSREPDSVNRDPYCFSSAFRLTFYATKVLSSISLEFIEQDAREILFFYLPLATQLVNDDVSQEGSKGLLDLDIPDIRDECAELVSEARLIIKDWFQSPTPTTDREKPAPNIFDFWEEQFESLQGTSPKSYNVAETFARVIAERDSPGTARSAESCLKRAKQIDGPSNPFVLPSVVAAFRDFIAAIPSGVRLCNELISDCTVFKVEDGSEGLRKIVTLNLLISGESNITQNVQKPRLVFLVKHLVDCLQSQSPPQGLVSEILKLLVNILPLVREIYGSHWSNVFEFLHKLWDDMEIAGESLPILHSSLRLFACLKSLATNESNDDLVDVWTASQKTHSPALIGLLAGFDSSLSYDQPLKITANVLSCQIVGLPIDHVEDINGLFSILSAPNRDIQRATYDVLHRAIPKLQEAVTLNVALSDAVARLPDELISLLLEVPTIDIISQAKVDDHVWIGLRCYLLSWKTVFDHFNNASLPVQESYVSNIKENNCLNPLLEFMFDFLQHQHGKLVDASKFDIRSFNLDESDPPQKETQCMLVHLYYLCLKYLPNLTKVWWTDSKKRVKGQVEAWTEKYISPLIIEDSLQSVNEWFSAQNFGGEDQPLQIKVSHRTAEIIASVDVDEDSPPTSVAISLPSTYPLQQAGVEGRARVAVDEKKWRSWLLTIQGVIMFSNGNLIDGLLAFRRNVQGALKGQSECAICYSNHHTTSMSAPQIPNLNTLRRGAGRGRLRGRGSNEQTTSDAEGTAAKDKIIQQTDTDASVSRLSAVELGYLHDPFAQVLANGRGIGSRRYPIINRGTYVRTAALDSLIQRFLNTNETSPRKRQIISLGAGSDTRVFQLLSKDPSLALVYHELDFPTNTATKIKVIRSSPLLGRTLGIHRPEDANISADGYTLHSKYLHIHPINLRTLSTSSSPTLLQGVDRTLPTLLISECCLIYLSPTDAFNVLSYFTQTVFPPSSMTSTALSTPELTSTPAASASSVPLALILYEPIRPDDPFGRTMVANLATRGIHLQTLHRYASLSAQRERLQGHGFVSGQGAADVDFIWERWISEEEKERVARLEMLDEIEEWKLLASHYCVAWGWREENPEGGVFEEWKEMEGQ